MDFLSNQARPDAVRGRVLSRVTVVKALSWAVVSYAASRNLEAWPYAYRIAFPVAGLYALAATWRPAGIRLRRRPGAMRAAAVSGRRRSLAVALVGGILGSWRGAARLLHDNPGFLRYQIGFPHISFDKSEAVRFFCLREVIDRAG